jgi:hypothetical protein
MAGTGSAGLVSSEICKLCAPHQFATMCLVKWIEGDFAPVFRYPHWC